MQTSTQRFRLKHDIYYSKNILPSCTKRILGIIVNIITQVEISYLGDTNISNIKLEYVKKIAIEIGVEIFTIELQSTRYHFGTYGSNTKASVEL